MFTTCQPLILASASPRRQRFLQNLGIEFTICTADIDETPSGGELPDIFAKRMAQGKAKAVAEANPTNWIIGADTVVTLSDNTILGKPANNEAAISMLKQLNNTTHKVITGVCLCHLDNKVETVFSETTEVTFTNTPEPLLRAYVRTGEPLDKAGSYGIQGMGSFLVSSINGSCTNVIGLPMSNLVKLLLQHKIIAAQP